jgi:ArsR family transcriptional regulator
MALKCAAEPTRLRMLALLGHGELSVSEICKVLSQSQPRVSRHLRLLTEAGFLDRFREQQSIYYRTPARLPAYGWLKQLLEQVDVSEPMLRRDRERVAQVLAARGRAAVHELQRQQLAPADGQLGEALTSALLQEIGPVSVGELLDIGTGNGELLTALARRARHAVGIDISSAALRVARTRLHGAGLSHCEFRRGDMYELPCDDASFDTVSMDRLLARAARPVDALREAARALRRAGRLIVVEQLEQLQGEGRERPLQQLRSWLADAGLTAARLRPCDVGDGQYLIATARHSL